MDLYNGQAQFEKECGNLNITSIIYEINTFGMESDGNEMELFEKLKQMCLESKSKNSYLAFQEDLWKDHPNYMEANSFLRMCVPPVLLVLGTFGNLFSFMILAKSMLKVSTYSYLAVLAIMDMLVLYIGLLRMWVGNFSVDVQHTSEWTCKIVNFLGYVSSDTSVWLIIAVTVERFIAVNFPLRAPRMCNVYRARFVIIGIILLICGTNIHIMWTVELHYIPDNGTFITKCEASGTHKFLVKEVWPWVDAAIYSFVPFVIITILNVLIIRQVLYARKRRSKLQNHEYTSKMNGLVNNSHSKKSNESSKKLTCMLLAVSFTFLLTTLPMNLVQIVSAFSGPNDDDVGSKEYALKFAKFTLTRTVVELLMYVNHSINFFLYCATGRKFRRQFKLMMCLCCHGKFSEYFKLNARSNMNSTNSYRLSRLTQSSPRSLVIECDKRFILNHSAK